MNYGEDAPLFDRRVPPDIVDALAPGGPFHGLVERALRPGCDEEALDLQLRANPKSKSTGIATLYVGLTKALDLEFDGRGRARVKPQTKFGPRPRPSWTAWQPREQLGRAWPAVLAWLDDVIRSRPLQKVNTEGVVQAALTRAEGQGFCVIDRESMPAFARQVAKDAAMDALRTRVQPVLETIGDLGADWTQRPTPFGNKLDALGVDAAGRVLIIEVKPGSETGALGWTPIQVAFYVWLFQSWAANEPSSAGVLQGMLDQRCRLTLLPAGDWSVSDPPRLVPVIAVGAPVKNPKVANERMIHTAEALATVDPDLVRDLEVWRLTIEGTKDTIKLGSLG
jgi:hypothetical protein